MSKKTSKRQVRYSTPAAGDRPVSPASTPGAGRLADRFEFNPDYTPVIKDLKRIATLAGGFFVILIVLSFFLR